MKRHIIATPSSRSFRNAVNTTTRTMHVCLYSFHAPNVQHSKTLNSRGQFWRLEVLLAACIPRTQTLPTD
eukprot:4269065-Pyramimonas_sp.AAC.1